MNNAYLKSRNFPIMSDKYEYNDDKFYKDHYVQ